MSPAEIAAALPQVSVSAVSYHVPVLDECGCVAVNLALPERGRQPLEPTVDDALVAALEATRDFDEEA
jgi:hypothetical protein